MIRSIHATAILLIVLLASLPDAWAEKRVALVIGNGAYPTASLQNPPNDAQLMGQTLRDLGFEVIERTDLTQIGMKKAISEFGTRLKDAGEDAVGMFFYAGHGVQAKGRNYLLPTDAQLDSEGDLEIYAVRANWVLGQMEDAGNRINLVVLDACRNNPFARSWKRSASSRGLARMDAPRGTLIAYATRPGDVAADGRGTNSPYTAALTTALKKPGLTLSDVFIDTRNAVMKATDDKQVPWEEGGLTSRFYFSGNGPASGQIAATQPQAPAVDEKALDLAFWNSVKDSADPAMFRAYLSQYPNGTFAPIASAKVKQLETPKQVAAVRPLPKQPSPAPADQPTPVLPAVGAYFTPGKVFRDCADCPEMVVLPAGSFQMGDIDGRGEKDEKPVHSVTITRPFAVGKFEITQAEWKAVMGKNPSGFNRNARNPVEYVSWADAQDFIRELRSRTGKHYRLLSEAEWEYAARAGTSTRYSWGNPVSSGHANCNGCGSRWDKKEPAPVGSFQANAFGLHDMHGNVNEWVEDCKYASYNYKSSGLPDDGAARTVGDCSHRGLRGGAWFSKPATLRAANRDWNGIGVRNFLNGFRVARTL